MHCSKIDFKSKTLTKLLKFFILIVLLYASYINSAKKSHFTQFSNACHACSAEMSPLVFALENDYADIAEAFILNGEPFEAYSLKEYEDGQADRHIKHPLITAISKGYISLAINLMGKIETGELNSI